MGSGFQQGNFPMCIGNGAGVGGTTIVFGVEYTPVCLALARLSKGYGSNFFLRGMAYTTQQN